jgi:hypothetical protein
LDGRGASGWEKDDEDDHRLEPYDPHPMFADDIEYLDGEGYATAADTFANEMPFAAVEGPKLSSLGNLFMSNGCPASSTYKILTDFQYN